MTFAVKIFCKHFLSKLKIIKELNISKYTLDDRGHKLAYTNVQASFTYENNTPADNTCCSCKIHAGHRLHYPYLIVIIRTMLWTTCMKGCTIDMCLENLLYYESNSIG